MDKCDVCAAGRDPLDVFADALQALVLTSTDTDATWLASKVLDFAVDAIEDLGKKHRSARPDMARTMRRHVGDLKGVVQRWRDDRIRVRKYPERP